MIDDDILYPIEYCLQKGNMHAQLGPIYIIIQLMVHSRSVLGLIEYYIIYTIYVLTLWVTLQSQPDHISVMTSILLE